MATMRQAGKDGYDETSRSIPDFRKELRTTVACIEHTGSTVNTHSKRTREQEAEELDDN